MKTVVTKLKTAEKGVALIMVFLIMTIILVIVMSTSTILVAQISISGNAGGSVSAFYAAETGIEKTLYIDRKQIVSNATRGFCSLCSVCNTISISDANTYCNNCTAVSLATDNSNGCDVTTCNNCQLNYDSVFNGKTYGVSAKVTPDTQDPNISRLNVDSKGAYQNVARQIELNSQTTISP